MRVIEIAGWSLIAAAVAWRFAWRRARATIGRVAVQAESELRRLQAESARWRSRAMQLSREIEAWKAGHSEGRSDVIGIVPLLVATAHDTVRCACGIAAQIDSGT